MGYTQEAVHGLLRNLRSLDGQFENTLSLGVKVLKINPKLMVDTKDERANHGLMTSDSLHVRTMWRPPTLKNIVTYDGDFTHIDYLEVWMPMDVV